MAEHTEVLSARGTGPIELARPARILLAEDEAAFRRLAAAALRRAGYEVLEVADGAAALDLIGDTLSTSSLDVPDVVVSDIKMPVLTGLQLAASLHNIKPKIPTILITAFGDPATHALAARLGAIATLDKPFDLDVLRELIDRIVCAPARQPRALVVDESVVQASALSEILCDEGAAATFATSAIDALDAVARQPPDVLVLDATLQGKATTSLLARIRERAPSLPAVVLSGFPVDHPHVAALIDARAAYVAKPADVPRLVALIRWLVRNGEAGAGALAVQPAVS